MLNKYEETNPYVYYDLEEAEIYAYSEPVIRYKLNTPGTITLKITTSTGLEVCVSEYHKIVMEDGSMKHAKDLKLAEPLASCNLRGDYIKNQVTSIEEIDMEVDHYHYVSTSPVNNIGISSPDSDSIIFVGR